MFDRLKRRFAAQPVRSRSHSSKAKKCRARLHVELLENRLVPTVLTVTTLTDSFDQPPNLPGMSLRDAIFYANELPGDNTIDLATAGDYKLSIPGFAGENDGKAGELASIPLPGGTLTIVNTSGGAVTVDGGNQSRVFDILPQNIPNQAVPVSFQGFEIDNGIAGNGGGIQAQGNVELTLTNMTVTGNSASGDGGGVFMNGGALTIANSIISSNSAGGNGGGVAEEITGLLSIYNSYIYGNSASGNGGGIFASGQALALSASTIATNKSMASGGGIELQTNLLAGAGSSITNTTIASNVASTNGGGVDAPVGFLGGVQFVYDTINANVATTGGGLFWSVAKPNVFTVQNSVIAQNIAGTDADAHDGTGPTANTVSMDLGNNVVGVDPVNLFPLKSSITGSNSNPVNPLLEVLQANGGPTVGAMGTSVTLPTEALGAGSVAIGHAQPDSITVDERGAPRAGDPPDAGAYQTLTGNQAFVEALYSNFLHRMGNLASPTDAGSWVEQLTSGATTPQTVANAIARSPEALAIDVVGIFGKLLGRVPDPAGGQFFVTFLQSGGTEEQMILFIASSAEYSVLAGSPKNVVTNLYKQLLGRAGGSAEIAYWTALLPSAGAFGVTAAILASPEYRDLEVGQLYGPKAAPASSVASLQPNLLQRTTAPAMSEINSWANTNYDILTIEVAFAGFPEYFQRAFATTGGTVG